MEASKASSLTERAAIAIRALGFDTEIVTSDSEQEDEMIIRTHEEVVGTRIVEILEHAASASRAEPGRHG